MFILFCCRWSTKDKCYQHLLIYTNKLVDRIGFEPMMLPEWEQIYSLSASTACIPVQNFCWFRDFQLLSGLPPLRCAGLPAIAF